ncbi:hypothetical protein EYF80_066891 [Liparis tanakae]|uniref:Uncharacterized protein n=1 Tax=Liparis tanakae TaxID=230148 RepID=A0A4Z2E2V5_9TELE|nr:hypothetical protein EYF80_066891 [Liparis tanakae]
MVRVMARVRVRVRVMVRVMVRVRVRWRLNSCSSELTSRAWPGSRSSWAARGSEVRLDIRLDMRPSWKS